MHLMAVKKSRKRSDSKMYLYSLDNALTAIKRDTRCETRYVKEVLLVDKRDTKGVPFLSKMAYKRVRALTSGRSLLV